MNPVTYDTCIKNYATTHCHVLIDIMSSGGARRKEKKGFVRRDREKQFSEGFREDGLSDDSEEEAGRLLTKSN